MYVMSEVRRQQLKVEFKQSRPTAGVYRITNTVTGKALLSSTPNLASMRNRFDFAQTMGGSALDLRLALDIKEHGIEAFSFEVLESLEVGPTAMPADVRRDLATLEQLWREKLADTPLY